MQSNAMSGHKFSQVPSAEIQRSSFDRSCGLKTTFDAGYLVPVFWDLIYPGDTFNLNMTFFARLATPFKPIMDNMYCDSFFFFVPMRLLWTNWEKFSGAQDNPGDSTSYSIPQIASPTTPGVVSNTLSDYFGLPVGLATSYSFNAWYHRAYNKVWNNWFRDENMQSSVANNMGDGPDTYGDYVLLRRGKRHDYFTSCLTAPQKGTAVTIPLGTSAPVLLSATTGVPQTIRTVASHTLKPNVTIFNSDASSNWEGTGGGTDDVVLDPNGTLYANLAGATSATINSLRQSFALQKLYERDARGGTRYTEIVRSHFGVVSPDSRLQRPEYLGGGTSSLNMNVVPQTIPSASPTAKDGQGNLAAFGTVSGSGHGFTKSFTEHGVIIGLVSVRADLTYQQGLDREFSYRTRFDMFYPALAQIGEQAVLNKEIYCLANGATSDDLVFGYQERFAEARYKSNKLTGLFRSNVSSGATTIDYWHLAQNFGSLPTLADTFIKETPPVNRIVQVTSQPQFLFDAYFKLICARPMPMFGVPGMIDRF